MFISTIYNILRLQAKIQNQRQSDELQSAREQQAEMENMRIRLDQGWF